MKNVKKNSRMQKEEETYAFHYFSKTPRIVEGLEENQPRWGRNCPLLSVGGEPEFFFFLGFRKDGRKVLEEVT